MRLAPGALLPLILLAAGTAQADRRNFSFLYEPKTLTAGELELEYYMTAALMENKLTDELDYKWAHQVEIEYGVTDFFDLSMYQMFSADGWTGYKLRGRYRPWYTGVLPIDLMVYFELIHDREGEIAFEEKIVLGRSFGRFYVSLDSTVEQGPIFGDTGYKWNEALGIGYQIAPWITVALENQLRFRWEKKQLFTSPDPVLELDGSSYYVGPTLSLASYQFWWNVSAAFRVAGDEDEAKYLLRVLWGVFL